MFLEQRLQTKRYFDQKASLSDGGAEAVGWFDRETQEKRFLVLSLMTDWTGCTLLDVGCGTGDFYRYLRKQCIDVEYTGIDCSAVMVKQAKQLNPGGMFSEQDFFDDSFSARYDFIVASGVFNYRVDDQVNFLFAGIKKMFDLCHQGITFNILSNCTPLDQQFKTFFYYDPVEVLRFCLTLTPYVELKQNYLPNDFTVSLLK